MTDTRPDAGTPKPDDQERVAVRVPDDSGTRLRVGGLARKHRDLNLQRAGLGVLVAASAVVVVLSLLRGYPFFSLQTVTMWVAVTLLAGGGAWVGDYWSWRWQMRSALRPHPDDGGQVMLYLGPESAQMHFPGGQSELEWGSFLKAVRTPDYWLLYCAPKLAWYFPQSALSESESQRVSRWIERGIESVVESPGKRNAGRLGTGAS